MEAVIHSNLALMPKLLPSADHHFSTRLSFLPYSLLQRRSFRRQLVVDFFRLSAAHTAAAGSSSFSSPRDQAYTVGDFMTRKERLHVVKTTTTIEDALETLVDKRITGFPVVNDDWKLVGVVSDYDLLALDSISGGSQVDATLFPNVDSSWKNFSEIQKLLCKTNGKVVGDLMTADPLYVHEGTSLEDAARLLLETKFRRLPVVDVYGKLVGIITRGDVVRAALQIKRASASDNR